MSKSKAPPGYREFYYNFGLNLHKSGSELSGICPFCLKDGDHFGVIPSTGQFKCLVCGEKGNHYDFLRMLHDEGKRITKQDDYERLSRNRRLKIETLLFCGLVRNPLLPERWLIPNYSNEQKLNNLYQAIPRVIKLPPGVRVPPKPTSWEIRSAGHPCTQQLYGADTLNGQQLILVGEGHWDRMALLEIVAHLRIVGSKADKPMNYSVEQVAEPDFGNALFQEIGIVAVPGATQFKSDWCKYLKNADVILLHDNDQDRIICNTCRGQEGYKAHLKGEPCPMCQKIDDGRVINPGREGKQKVLTELDDAMITPRSIMELAWRQGDPKDIRDLLSWKG